METNKTYQFKPTFGAAYGTGWKVMRDNFLRFLLVIIVLGLLVAPMSALKSGPSHDFHWDNDFGSMEHFLTFSAIGIAAAFIGFIGLLYNLLVLPVFRYGGKMMFLQGVRRQEPEFDNLISGFRKNYLNIVLASLLTSALIAIGLICILVPGIIIACRLVFTPYLVMDRGLDPIKAVEESWRLTRGHGWTIFFMGFVSFFIMIGGFICLFFGAFISVMWIKSSFATLYHSVLIEKGMIEPVVEEVAA